MLLCWCFLVSFRITRPVGEINYIAKLPAEKITSFTQSNGLNVLLFSDRPKSCDFANFAISNFSGEIKFALAQQSLAVPYKCDAFPCVAAFQNGKPLRNGPPQAAAFTIWCQNLIYLDVIQLTGAEQLQAVLEVPGVCVFGVDVDIRPRYLKPGDLFYSGPLSIFEELGLNVEKSSLYVYRHADRNLIRVKGNNFESLFQTDLIDIYPPFLSPRKYIGGFIFGMIRFQDPVEMDILARLAKKFKNVGLGIVPQLLAQAAGYELMEQSQFVLFKPENLSVSYSLRGEDAKIFSKLVKFVDAVLLK
jgi:hypothetical protein